MAADPFLPDDMSDPDFIPDDWTQERVRDEVRGVLDPPPLPPPPEPPEPPVVAAAAATGEEVAAGPPPAEPPAVVRMLPRGERLSKHMSSRAAGRREAVDWERRQGERLAWERCTGRGRR